MDEGEKNDSGKRGRLFKHLRVSSKITCAQVAGSKHHMCITKTLNDLYGLNNHMIDTSIFHFTINLSLRQS